MPNVAYSLKIVKYLSLTWNFSARKQKSVLSGNHCERSKIMKKHSQTKIKELLSRLTLHHGTLLSLFYGLGYQNVQTAQL